MSSVPRRKRSHSFVIPLVFEDPSSKRVKAALQEFAAKKNTNPLAGGITPSRKDVIAGKGSPVKKAGVINSIGTSPQSVEESIDSPTPTTPSPAKLNAPHNEERSYPETPERHSPVTTSSVREEVAATVGPSQSAPRVSPLPGTVPAKNARKDARDTTTSPPLNLLERLSQNLEVPVATEETTAVCTPNRKSSPKNDPPPAIRKSPVPQSRENAPTKSCGTGPDLDSRAATDQQNDDDDDDSANVAIQKDRPSASVLLGDATSLPPKTPPSGKVKRDVPLVVAKGHQCDEQLDKEQPTCPVDSMSTPVVGADTEYETIQQADDEQLLEPEDSETNNQLPVEHQERPSSTNPKDPQGESLTTTQSKEQECNLQQTLIDAEPSWKPREDIYERKGSYLSDHQHMPLPPKNAVEPPNFVNTIVKEHGVSPESTRKSNDQAPLSLVRPPRTLKVTTAGRSVATDQGLNMSHPSREQNYEEERTPIDEPETTALNLNGNAVKRIVQFVIIPVLLGAAIAWFFPREIRPSAPLLLEIENIPKLTLRDILLNDELGFHLAMAPAFFGFYGYFGALAAWYDMLDSKTPPIRSVTGASAGAMAAVLIAAGIEPKIAADFCATVTLDQFADFPGYGALFKGEKFEEMMHTFLVEQGKTVPLMEEAVIPVTVSAYDLRTFRGTILREGPMAKAARSSATFPLLFQPVGWKNSTHEFTFIDGGIADMYGLLGLKETMDHKVPNRVVNLSVGAFVGSNPPGPATFSEDKFDKVEVISVSLEGLPQPGPLALENGPLAYASARDAMKRSLDTPLEPVVETGGRRVRQNHYKLAIKLRHNTKQQQVANLPVVHS